MVYVNPLAPVTVVIAWRIVWLSLLLAFSDKHVDRNRHLLTSFLYRLPVHSS